jgi:O-antigen/teichoic acid export membrane protein
VKLSRSLVAALASSVGATAISLLVIPHYLRFLGLEAYGVIGFFAALQAVLQVLDLGLGPTLNREVARFRAIGDHAGAASLLHTLAVVSWVVAACIGAAAVGASPALAGAWFRPERLSPGALVRAVELMGLVIAFRWPAAIYTSALLGAERLVLASLLGLAGGALANLGAVAALALVSPTLTTFFLWQAGAAAVTTAALRWAAWRTLGRPSGGRFDVAELRRVWRFSVAMGVIALSSVIFTQLDKAILSRTLPLQEFGQYVLATTIAAGLYLLVTPFFNVLFPRFCALVVAGDEPSLLVLYRQATRLLSAGLFPLMMLLLISGEPLVQIWTGDAALAARVAPLVAILGAGAALHGVMFIPYALQLAYGATRLPLLICGVLLVVQVPLQLVLSLRYGAVGGAWAWLALHVLYLGLGTWLTHRRLLPGVATRWLLRDVGVPLGLSLLVGVAGSFGLIGARGAPWARLGAGAGLALVAMALAVATSPEQRRRVLALLSPGAATR